MTKKRPLNTNHNTLGYITEKEQINKPSKQRNQGEQHGGGKCCR